jgi:hypothetical protein
MRVTLAQLTPLDGPEVGDLYAARAEFVREEL